MAVNLNPYVSFQSQTREAMTFYQSVLGGELTFSTFGEYGGTGSAEEDAKIMHSMLVTDDLTLMAADTPTHMSYEPGSSVRLSLSGDDADKLTAYFAGLAEGGEVTVPLEKQMWGDTFGMLTDKFGMEWMVNIAG